MKLGPKEKQILKKLIPGEFTSPSIYLDEFKSCPSNNHSLQRIVEKGFAVFRWETQTPEERKSLNGVLCPGREAAEYNAALRPTQRGVKRREIVKRRKTTKKNFKVF